MNLTGRDKIMAGVIGFGLINLTITRAIFTLMAFKCPHLVEQATGAAMAFEANPVAAFMVNSLDLWVYVLPYLLIPAVMIAMYIVLKRAFLPEQEHLLDMVILTFLFMTFYNFANDLGGLLGVLFG